MSDQDSSASMREVVDDQRKRKRSIATDDNDGSARPNPNELPSSQNAAGVFVDIPAPSSSAMAAYHATHLPSSQMDSQVSLPGSIFDELNNDNTQAPSGSEYIPSTQADNSSSSVMPSAAVVDTSAFRPLPSISTRVFEPYLDDTTGMALDVAENRIADLERERRERRDRVENEVDNSSPVESFSPAEQLQQLRPEDVPRIGAWILPELTAENSNPNPPDYTSQEVLSQIPFPIPRDEDEEDSESDIVRQIAASQPSPPRRRIQRDRRQQEQSASPVAQPPIQSTPAFAAARQQPDEPQLPPTQPIPSQPLPPFSSTPALPREDNAEPPAASSSSVSHSASSASSVAWSTLPRPEIVELVHRSPHIPSFLKDEIERFIQRASRTSSSSSSTSAGKRGSPRRRSNSQSQSQQSSGGNDDSETQEDGFLRTKKLWCMDLLLFPSPSSSSQASLPRITSQVVQQRLTQSQLSQASTTRGPVAIILLLDTVEVTFDIHELEESLASVLRSDRRYSVQYDADGRKWNTGSQRTPTPATAPAPAPAADDLDAAKAEITRLQKRLEASSAQIDALTTTNLSLQKDLSESQAQHDFVRSLYDRASASATSAQASASEALAKVALQEEQLSSGLALHQAALDSAITRWKGRVRQLEAEREFATAQREMTEQGEEVRRKAALWDAYQAEERDRERTREERIRINEEKRRKLAAQLGGPDDVAPSSSAAVNVEVADGLGPFARPLREPSPVDELDELAALAREAAEAGDSSLAPLSPPGGGRTRRSRRTAAPSDNQNGGNLSSRNASNQPPPPNATEIAAQKEAAELSSTHALHDSRLELEDQFEIFSNTPQAAQPESDSGPAFELGDFGSAPSVGLSEDIFNAGGTGFDQEQGQGQGQAMTDGNQNRDQPQEVQEGWGSLPTESNDLLPSFNSDSLILQHPSSTVDGEQESVESTFRPHTQA
ncbi:uncharacterized protein UTRI_03581_B [Ustilago trichophora]|uniref:Uncharacterized protein n=1 Tax=Ustilago trichophora TaxID=86804 RepID=A0A5C3E1G8_9BASI|nr:uncharacterized protein UTRI_03581_B [Ustilago trichophora]